MSRTDHDSPRRSETFPLLSVIVPLHNSHEFAPFLGQSIREGLLECEPAEFEVILVDDGSADRSLEEFLAVLPLGINVKSHKFPDNQGPGTARNAGLDLAEGDFLAFWDADDQGNLPTYVDLARKLSNSDRLVGALGYEMRDSQASAIETSIPSGEADLCHLLISRPAIWRFVFRRKGLVDLGVRFPGMSYGEDLIFMLDIARRDKRSVSTYSKLGYVHYLGRSGSLSTSPANKESKRLLRVLSRVLDRSGSLQMRALSLQWFWRVWARSSASSKFAASPSLVLGTTRGIASGYFSLSICWFWKSRARPVRRARKAPDSVFDERRSTNA